MLGVIAYITIRWSRHAKNTIFRSYYALWFSLHGMQILRVVDELLESRTASTPARTALVTLMGILMLKGVIVCRRLMSPICFTSRRHAGISAVSPAGEKRQSALIGHHHLKVIFRALQLSLFYGFSIFDWDIYCMQIDGIFHHAIFKEIFYDERMGRL